MPTLLLAQGELQRGGTATIAFYIDFLCIGIANIGTLPEAQYAVSMTQS